MTAKKFRTHYDNLKVARDAPPEVIRAAYRALSQRYHPDKNPGDERAARIMAVVNASYDVLSDPVARKAHDEWIASQENNGRDFNDQGESTSIRADRRKVDQPPAGATLLNWMLERIGKLALALMIPLLIAGLFKLPATISKVSKANAISSSVRERARADCNAELSLLRMFMQTAINPENEKVPEDIRMMFMETVSSEQSRFDADARQAALLIWGQRDELRMGKVLLVEDFAVGSCTTTEAEAAG